MGGLVFSCSFCACTDCLLLDLLPFRLRPKMLRFDSWPEAPESSVTTAPVTVVEVEVEAGFWLTWDDVRDGIFRKDPFFFVFSGPAGFTCDDVSSDVAAGLIFVGADESAVVRAAAGSKESTVSALTSNIC